MDLTLGSEWAKAAGRYEDLLGHRAGERLSTPEQIANAVQTIAITHPETCSLEVYGRSVEGRPLQLLTIASPANLARVEEIRRTNQALNAGGDCDTADLPATVWVIANVHGDEHSTAEAAVALAAYLAEGADPLIQDAVVCIDPCQNPDGRARSVNAYYSLFGLKPRRDANAAEHNDPWGGGRGNHYFFDMNRDWFPMTQPESRARVASFLKWRPQVVADLHEMWWDSRFFFPPPASPMNPNLGAHVLRWWEQFGREIGRTFDANGWDYWTGEIFDAFYPGYGEAFPSIHGSIGMTFEQASSAGIEVQRKDGTVLTFEEGIRHHFAAALTTCRVSAVHRIELLTGAADFIASALEVITPSGIHAYAFPDAGAGSPAVALAELLQAQGIVVEQLADAVEDGWKHYIGGDSVTQAVPKGAIVVRLDQPAGRAARAILERETEIDQAWLAEQVKRLSERAPVEVYDHTAWALPLAMGVPTYATDVRDLPLEPWSGSAHRSTEGDPAYGWLIPPAGMSAAKAACSVLGIGGRVHVAKREFSVDGRDYDRGTVVIKRADQPVEWAAICHALPASAVPVDSAWTDSGIDLGSDHVSYVKPPRIAVLYAEPASTLSYGWIAHLFEQRLDMPFTPIRIGTLKEADLRLYDVIILPSGNKDAYAGGLAEDTWKALREWARQGATLIALGGAAACIAGKGKDWTTCKVVADLREPGSEAKTDKDEVVPPEFHPERVAGAVLRVLLDRHHAAALGYGLESHVLCATELLLTPSVEGRNVAVFAPEDRLVVAGYVWEKMRPVLPGKAYLVDETLGRGHLLMFADDPNQRGYWDVTSRLFVNAVLFGAR